MLKKIFNIAFILLLCSLFPVNATETKLTLEQGQTIINKHLQTNNLDEFVKNFKDIIQIDLQSPKNCKIYIPRLLGLDIFINNQQNFNSTTNSYWDGKCNNGFASGLGRLVFLIANNHYEIILNLNGDTTDALSPYIIYDFKKLTSEYVVPDKDFPKKYGKIRKIEQLPQTDIITTYYHLNSLNEAIGYNYSLLKNINSYFHTIYNIKFENIDASKISFDMHDISSYLYVYDLNTSEILMSNNMSKVGFTYTNNKNKSKEKIPNMSDDLYKLVLDQISPAIDISRDIIYKISPLQLIEKKYLYEHCQKVNIKYFNEKLKEDNICTWGNEYKDSLINARLLYLQKAYHQVSKIEDDKIKQNLKDRINFLDSSIKSAQKTQSNLSKILSFLELFNIFL